MEGALGCALRLAAREPAAQGIILLSLYPALTPSARKRASGPCWANFATRLTALSVGVVCCCITGRALPFFFLAYSEHVAVLSPGSRDSENRTVTFRLWQRFNPVETVDPGTRGGTS